jgi:putative ABC transport system permease protein
MGPGDGTDEWTRERRVAATSDTDIDDELAFHLESRVADLMRAGMREEAARERARREFGDVRRIRERLRTLGRRRARGRYGADLAEDVQLGFRALRRRPAFAASILATLALVIGAATTIVALVDGVLLRPLPYPAPDRLAVVWEQNATRDIRDNVVSMPLLEAWQRDARDFTFLAGLVPHTATLIDGTAERELGAQVSPSWFGVVGVAPALGRGFTVADGTDVVVLSHGMWADRFGADPDVVGRRIHLGPEPLTVVGVMPEGFTPPAFGWLGRTQRYWVPIVPDPDNRKWGRFLLVVGRMAPGASVAAADQEVKAIAARRAPEEGGREEWTADVVSLHRQVTGDVRAPLLVLLTAVGFLLAMGLLNATNLVLARTQRRTGELVLRAALGAGRRRIARQLLGESLAVVVVAGPMGALLSWLGVSGLRAILPASVPRASDVHVGAMALGAALLAASLTAVATGLVPALRIRPGALEAGLRQGSGARATTRLGGRSLVVVEVALALIMSVGAVLAARSFAALLAVPLGFQPSGVVSFRVTLPSDRYGDDGRRAFLSQLLGDLRSTPGVQAAGATSGLPITGWGPATGVARMGDHAGGSAAPVADVRIFTDGYFEALRVPVVRGHASGSGSGRGSRRGGETPVVVNETMARALWPGLDPVGRRAEVSFGTPDSVVVAGVVADVPMGAPSQPVRPTLYYPYADWSEVTMDVAVRSTLAPTVVAAAARKVVAGLDGTVPVYHVAVLQDAVDDATAEPRVEAVLLGGFAAMALLLAAVGIYGVLNLEVSRRRRELAVRLALGAAPGRVGTGVVLGAMALAGIGLVIGVGGALVLTRFMAAILYGVVPNDPATFVFVACILLIATAVAAWPSARRASTVDPMESMRAE